MRLLLLLPIVLLSFMSYGQSTFSNTGSGLNDISRYMDDEDSTADDGIAEDDADHRERRTRVTASLEDVTIEVTDSTVVFDNLPAKGGISAHLTDAAGEELETRAITARRPGFGIRYLPEGLYFVTLTYKNQRKAFELNREKDVKKGQP